MKNSKPSQNKRILQRLSDGKWHSILEFIRMCIPRYSARIHELKKQGYNLDKRSIKGKSYEAWRLLKITCNS